MKEDDCSECRGYELTDDTVEIPVICGDCALQEVCCRVDAD